MMRLALIACVFCLCGALAEDVFVTKYFATPRNLSDTTSNAQQVIKYNIKVPAKFPKNGPIFYGCAGQVRVEDIQNQYKLFEQIIPDFNNAVVVFVEQRYFGNSTLGEDPITNLANLTGLKLDGAVSDNVLLIQELSIQLKTKNFFLFGAGHGGLISGYVANTFANDAVLSKNYNVLAWSSSVPIRYLRQGSAFDGNDLQELNRHFANLLINDGGCTDVRKFGILFRRLRNARSTDTTLQTALNLNPQLPIAAADNVIKRDMKEFMLFLRKNLLNLAYDNRMFKLSDGSRITDATKTLKLLCQAIAAIPEDTTPLNTDNVNTVLEIIIPNYKRTGTPLSWRLIPPPVAPATTSDWNRNLAITYYQDCTDLQLVYCPKNKDDLTDPFASTAWKDDADCTNLPQYDMLKQAECQGLFGPSIVPTSSTLNIEKYPREFKKNVIVSTNKKSIFYDATATKEYKDEKNFAWGVTLEGADNLEFEAPKDCDSPKMNDVRYLALRAFTCFTGLAGNSDEVCATNLFNDDANNKDGKPYDDPIPSATIASCPVNTTITFPFGSVHTAVKFVDPEGPPPTSPQTAPTGSSTVTVRSSPRPVTKKSNNGAGSMIPMMSVFLSTMFVWFTAFSLH